MCLLTFLLFCLLLLFDIVRRIVRATYVVVVVVLLFGRHNPIGKVVRPVRPIIKDTCRR